MKHSHSKIAWIGTSVLISLMFASGASAQSSAGLLWAYKDNPDNGSMARASVVVFNRAKTSNSKDSNRVQLGEASAAYLGEASPMIREMAIYG